MKIINNILYCFDNNDIIDGNVEIPDSVTSICKGAFDDCDSLTSILVGANNAAYQSIDGNLYSKDGKTLIQYAIGKTASSFAIPDGVTSIGYAAFGRCRSLTEIIIPDSVTSIDRYAFFVCKSLKSVTIGHSVTSICYRAFFACSNLTNVYITDMAAWCNISFEHYDANPLYYAHNLYLNNQLVKEITADDLHGATSIGAYAFSGCSSLTSITIPDSVTSIGKSAFYECSSLKSVTIGNSVTSIGLYAFYECSSLTSVEIPDGVTSIGAYAFSGCSSLTSITIPDSVTSIGDGAFKNCSSLTRVKIENSATGIDAWAFDGCYNLKSKKSNYKAFKILKNGNLYCLNKKYKEGVENSVRGNLVLCENGIHYCTNLFEIFNYYCGKIDEDIAIYEIEVGEKVLTSDSSKCCTNSCVLKKRLYREDVIRILNGEV